MSTGRDHRDLEVFEGEARRAGWLQNIFDLDVFCWCGGSVTIRLRSVRERREGKEGEIK
jgi:hypothetical protein